MTAPRVLVIDDDPSVLKSLQLLLSDDCEVTTCADPRVALELVRSTTFDVIVTDYKMPHLTGGEFAAQLHREVTPPPYCLLLTGTPDAVKTSMPGAKELVMVLAKPFDPGRLLRLVLQVGRLGLIRRGAVKAEQPGGSTT
jgi:CheY-like chemotaxis protein